MAESFAKAAETLIVLQRTRRRFKELAQRRNEEGDVIKPPKSPPLKENPICTFNFVYSEVVEQTACNYKKDRGVAPLDEVAIVNAKPICRNVIRRWAKKEREAVHRQTSTESTRSHKA
jgi:hypothetical protein